MVNKNNLNEIIEFIYVDRDAEIIGIDVWAYYELSLKKGWNSVKFDYDRSTCVSFVPDENYIWINGIGVGAGGDGGDVLLDLEKDNVIKISGTINVTVDEQFPASGIIIEAFNGGSEPIGTYNIISATNPISWEIEIPEQVQYINFRIKIYPDTTTQYVYNVYVRNNGNYTEVSENTHELSNVELSDINITTTTSPFSITGINGNTSIFASYYIYNEFFRRNISMQVPNNGSYYFKIPNMYINTNNERWLWFGVETSSGYYLSKGRLNLVSEVNLNIAQMYKID